MKSTPKRGILLRRPEDVRRLLSRIINQTVHAEIDTDICRAVSYSCNILLRAMETTEIEQRLSALEEKINGKA